MRIPFAGFFKPNWKAREKRALRKASRQIDRALSARAKQAEPVEDYPAPLRGK